MKKIIIIAAAVILALTVIILIFSSREALFVRSPFVVLQNPVITYITGDAEVLKKNGEQLSWLPLEVGAKLKNEDVVRTGSYGNMDIRFSDKTLIRLAEDTQLSIEEITVKRLEIDISRGIVFAKFGKLFKDQNFSITTTTAAAGVRGTDLVFDVDEKSTDIYALSGITEIYNPELPEERVLLAFQSKTTVREDLPPTAPVEIPENQLKDYQRTINSIHSEKVLLVTHKIQFEPNTDYILPSSLKELDEVVKLLSKTSYNVRIDGHTANAGSAAAMYSLSIRRAEKIRDYLKENGINGSRLSIQGFGGSKPLTDNSTEDRMATNRRVEFVIID